MKKLATIVSVLFSVMLISSILKSCSKEDDSGYRVYTIDKGNHYSDGPIDKLFGNDNKSTSWEWEVIFDASCIYSESDLFNPSNYLDVNKLIGFSDCDRHHSQYSCRVGWRASGDSIELLIYKRDDNNISFKPLEKVYTDQVVNITLEFKDTIYISCIDGNCDTLDRSCSKWSGRKYSLFPFFGGQEVAPREMKIRIK
tara:strand:- start:573 stop:1166 length:594 start_codon:yes stop_codon:yes gene_type:complete